MTPPEDYERLMESIYIQRGEGISDRETYDEQFNKFFEQTELTHTQNTAMRDTVWRLMEDRILHKSAGGKALNRDRLTTSKVIAKDQAEYVRLGADKSDLKGLDTKKDKFSYLGMAKKKVVYCRRVWVNKKVRYRNDKGQFCKFQK